MDYISFFLFILAVLSKIMAITLPCILILYDYLFYKKITWNNIKEKLPFFLITFLLVITNIFVLYSSMFASKNLSFSIINNMFIVSHVFLLYIYKLILPIKLSLIYPYPANLNTQLPVSYIVSLPLALILFAFIVLINRYSRHIAFGSLFFLITITPVLQILPITCTSLIYDRFTYIPSIGISYIIGHGFNYLYFKQWRYSKILKIFLIIFLACIIIIFSFLTLQRCYVWKDSITLWNNVLHTYPDMSVAYNNRGHAYLLKGEKDKAISDFTKLITLFPGMAEAYYNRACVYDLKGERNKAISDFTEALKINPYFGEAYYNRGNAYYKEGKLAKEIADNFGLN